MSKFIVLIGGPSTFMGCDKEHDQTWLNFVVPMQLAGTNKLYNLEKGEKLYWLVYEPPYHQRWADDSVLTPAEHKQSDGFWLHSIPKHAADAVVKSCFQLPATYPNDSQ